MLLHKLAAGLRESALMREVFQSCDQFMDVDNLKTHCVAYKAANRDATAGARHDVVVAADVTNGLTATNDVIGAAQVTDRCGNCNGQHPTSTATFR